MRAHRPQQADLAPCSDSQRRRKSGAESEGRRLGARDLRTLFSPALALILAMVIGLGCRGVLGIDDMAYEPGYCQQRIGQVGFCEDFDEHPLDHYWPVVQTVTGLSTLEHDDRRFLSAPHSLLASTKPVQGAEPSIATLLRAFPVPPKSAVHVAYDVHIDPSLQDVALITHAIAFGQADSEADLYKLSYVQGAGKGYVEEALPRPQDGGTRVFHSLPMACYLPLGRWARVKMDITLGPTPLLAVFIDDVPGMEARPLDSTWQQGSQVQLYLGIVYVKGPKTDLNVNFDNVTLTME